MSSEIKYIGMDVHKEAITIAVRNGSGKLVMESTYSQEGKPLHCWRSRESLSFPGASAAACFILSDGSYPLQGTDECRVSAWSRIYITALLQRHVHRSGVHPGGIWGKRLAEGS